MAKERLKALASEAIRSGQLPRCGPNHRVYGGKGDGSRCACCGKPIDRAQIQYDLDSTPRELTEQLSLHLDCYLAWLAASDTLPPPAR